MDHQQPSGDQFLFGQNFVRQNELANQSLLRPDKISSFATKGADGLSKTLGNVQQVLKVIQTTAPIVQQYGPMIKNLPALYRMMKAVNEIDDEEVVTQTKTDEAKETQVVLKEDVNEAGIEEANISNNSNPTTEPSRRKTGESKPLLFI